MAKVAAQKKAQGKKHVSIETRKNIQDYYKQGYPQSKIAKLLNVTRRTVNKWKDRANQNYVKKTGKLKFDENIKNYVNRLITNGPTTSTEIQKTIYNEFNKTFSKSSIFRWLRILKEKDKNILKDETRVFSADYVEKFGSLEPCNNVLLEVNLENDLFDLGLLNNKDKEHIGMIEIYHFTKENCAEIQFGSNIPPNTNQIEKNIKEKNCPFEFENIYLILQKANLLEFKTSADLYESFHTPKIIDKKIVKYLPIIKSTKHEIMFVKNFMACCLVISLVFIFFSF